MKMYNTFKKNTLVLAACCGLVFAQYGCSRTDSPNTSTGVSSADVSGSTMMSDSYAQTNQSAGLTTSADLHGLDESKIPNYTALDIRQAYEEFVAHVEAHKAGFSNDDWDTVEKYWNQLDDRKNAIQDQLSDKDKWEIGKAKAKYIAMKNANKAGNTASKVGSDLKEVGKDVSNSKVGEATKEAGKDVAAGAKKAGKAVGKAAKKTAEKVEKAVEEDDE
ncbi:DUF6565 domain-containing protein [Rufibacter psychrotolerans]|uniref:DUF6565 domain-containing protein n=1 Tax=Rufibacter psychrotolerans TaxID=2812556 RepID=UPI001966F375|nr:DUF6565 domain-containing protein [Rufibacter sp. SYSU D00308]